MLSISIWTEQTFIDVELLLAALSYICSFFSK